MGIFWVLGLLVLLWLVEEAFGFHASNRSVNNHISHEEVDDS